MLIFYIMSKITLMGMVRTFGKTSEGYGANDLLVMLVSAMI